MNIHKFEEIKQHILNGSREISQRKLENTYGQMKITHIKTYGLQRKQC